MLRFAVVLSLMMFSPITAIADPELDSGLVAEPEMVKPDGVLLSEATVQQLSDQMMWYPDPSIPGLPLPMICKKDKSACLIMPDQLKLLLVQSIAAKACGKEKSF